MWRLALLFAVITIAVVLSCVTQYAWGIACPPDPTNLPPGVTMAHPTFCVAGRHLGILVP
jgi:hypothetical protein